MSLEAERELREQFVSTLSHDLRTPLSTILVAAQLLARHPEQSDLTSSLPQRIIRSASRADRMIQDLLDVTRIAAGNPLPLEVTQVDLASLIADVVAEFTPLHSNPIAVDVEGPVEGYWSPRSASSSARSRTSSRMP